MADARRLESSELEAAMTALDGWVFDGQELLRTWTFPDFPAAMDFVNRVASLAEAAGHHPDIDIRYNKVRLALVSHDLGGVTSVDVEMAKELNGFR